MVKIPQIPLYLLVHDIKVKETQESSSGSLHPKDNVKVHEFDHVRVQSKDMASQTSNGPDNKGSYILFIDAVNSINSDDYLIREGDRVYWNGVSRKVMGISAIYALDEHVHH